MIGNLRENGKKKSKNASEKKKREQVIFMYSVWMTKIKEFQFYWSSQNILGRMDYIKHTERNKVILLKKIVE